MQIKPTKAKSPVKVGRKATGSMGSHKIAGLPNLESRLQEPAFFVAYGRVKSLDVDGTIIL